MRLRNTVPLFGILLFAPCLAFGLGSQLPDQDAAATARGNAFTATADNPSAIFYNPAGITQLDGLNSRSGMYGISMDVKYDPLHDHTGAHSSTAHEPFQPVPQFYLSYHPTGKPIAVGFGLYSPFGLKSEWPDDVSFRQAGMYGSLQFIDANPVLAIQVTRSLSIAAGFSLDYVNAQLREGLSPMPGDAFILKGSSVTFGANAGLLWKPTERQSIGITYRSPVNAGLGGHTRQTLNGFERGAARTANAEIAAGKSQLAAGKVKLEQGIAYINSLPIPPPAKAQLIAQANAQYAQASAKFAQADAQYQAQLAAEGVPANGTLPTTFPTLDANGSLEFPQSVTLGYSFRPTPDWNLEADIQWTDWDSFNTLSLQRGNGSTINVPFDWTHSFLYELGITHTIGAYKLSAGYMYSENSVPAASFNPVIPDAARNIFSLGVGRSFGRCEIDLAYQLSVGVPRTVVNDSVADGRYSSFSNAVSISLGYHF